MHILVTAGNTQTPLDRVRCITNIFTGRTGAKIAAAAFDRGHAVTLLASHADALADLPVARPREAPNWRVRAYRTFDDLDAALGEELTTHRYDALIHSAAISDYRPAGMFTPAPGTTFDPVELAWESTGGKPRVADAAAGKVKSSFPELWLRLVPTPKLVDKVRSVWGFAGILVKFKLEVGVSDAELLDIAERSRAHSGADLLCANTEEGRHEWAFVGAGPGGYARVARPDLPTRLLEAIEAVAARGR